MRMTESACIVAMVENAYAAARMRPHAAGFQTPAARANTAHQLAD
ncbi:hypothetical protein XCR_4473 [Xanthomonas campestris pv. raphani 756C]|nr:hypothetical protein XCR_4473 [Xanthomonas campestris pv. raphani 756C]